LKEQAELKKGTENEIRSLEYCLLFAEHQYGCLIVGKSYRERGDGSRKSNWNVVITLESLCFNCSDIYISMADNSGEYGIRVETFKKAIYYYKKSISLLEPWRVQLDLDGNGWTDNLNKDQISDVYFKFSKTEVQLSDCHNKLDNYDKATDSIDVALFHVSQVIVEKERIYLTFEALTKKGNNLGD
jgi:hypothetical protein